MEHIPQAVSVQVLSFVQAKAFDFERRHIQGQETARSSVKTHEIHQHKMAPVFLVSGDSLIIVQEIAATVQNRLISVDFDPLGWCEECP